MKTLLINTCTNRIIVAIADSEATFSSCNEIIENQMSNIIMTKIEKCFEDAGLKPNDIDQIIVAIGPGSYTGIRIGVTIAKTMAWALNKKIIPISSLEFMISGYEEEKLLVPYIDARREAVFTGVYNKNLDKFLDDQYITIKKLIEYLKGKDYIFVGDDNTIKCTSPLVNFQKIINKHQNDAGVNPHEVNPHYLKNTEAEENLKNA